MYTQRSIFTVDQCNEFLDLYKASYDQSFRLDWDHEARHQRLIYVLDEANRAIVTDSLLQHHSTVCSDLDIHLPDPYLLEIFVSKYEVGEGVGWHKDKPTHEYDPPYYNERVYNFSVCLNDNYTGGSLEVDESIVDTSVGTCTMFPVSAKHRVQPVTDGTRYSLIGWVYRKPLL